MKSKMILAAVAATLLSTSAFAAPPTADQVSVPAEQSMSRHQARMMALFQSPDQFMMFRMQVREATHGMSRDQKRSYRRAQIQKVQAMNDGQRSAWLHGLQAKWDAMPADRKQRMEARMENHQNKHHDHHGGGHGQNGGQNAGAAPYDQSDDDMSAPPRQQ